ncbi:DUF4493 domain-containing protein [Parabacteroides sp. PF5-9]|uniref:DUF4493 domain-containing protein n=1 Tax=Parabacteroides sp. PF5-9 TaxID=1742404 RepID=UPI002473A050|nr:DUF4493 domain-containing protein [Parabacteroides sp. PF5-9]MDH6359241.1 hypothetical protein [Parabacteroides sp. PF5-9]
MMKKDRFPLSWIAVKDILPLLAVILFSTGLFSCNDDSDSSSNRSGALLLSLSADTTFRQNTTTKAISDEFYHYLDVEDYTVQILQGETIVHSFPTFSEMPDELPLPVGKYTLMAYKGDNAPGRFMIPYFEGRADFTIESEMRTPITVTCQLANTRVTVSYSSDFIEAYPSYALHFNTSYMSEQLTMNKGETRAAYFRSDKGGTDLEMTLELRKIEDDSTYYYKPTPIAIEPRQNVNLQFKTDGEAVSGIGLVVTLNNDLDGETTLNMTVPEYAWGDVEAPTLGKDNFEKVVTNISYNELREQNEFYYLDYIVPAAVGKTIVSIHKLENGQNTSTEYDLATTEGINAAQLLGITISDQANNSLNTTLGTKSGRIHFTDALAKLPYSKNSVEYTYTVYVVDALPVNPNSTETATLKVTPNPVTKPVLTGQNSTDQTILATESLSEDIVVAYDTDAGIQTATMEVKRNGNIVHSYNILSDNLPRGIVFENNTLTFDKSFVRHLEVEACKEETYTFTLNASNMVDDEFTNSPMSFTITLQAAIEIVIPDGNVWAWKAEADILIPGLTEQNLSDLNVNLKVPGGSSIPLTDFLINDSGATVSIPGLTAGEEYELEVTFRNLSDTKSFTTEEIVPVENGNMNLWYLSRTSCKYGSSSTWNIPVPYLNSIAKDGHWVTNNNETAGKVYRITTTTTSEIPKGCFPTVVYEARDAVNEFAVIIRSIDASKENNKARGELVYDNPISSRPSSMTFEYAYTSVNNENFVSDIILYAGEKEIGRGSRPASVTTSETYKECTIPVVYTDTESKATRIKIFFASTDKKTGFGIMTEEQIIKAPNPMSTIAIVYDKHATRFKDFPGVYCGSTLKIDNVTLNYSE